MTYQITVSFTLVKRGRYTKCIAKGLYFPEIENAPIAKEELQAIAKKETEGIIRRHYKGSSVDGKMKVSVKQIQVNFIISKNSDGGV
jgi:hypothetical protein